MKDSHDPTKTYKNKQGYVFWWTFGFQGWEQPKSLQSQWQFQMSHIEVCPSASFCSFIGTHILSLAEMLRLARGQSCSSEVTTALISFSLQVIVDPWPAITNLHKEMKSRRRAVKLCKILYLWRDDRYRSSTNQNWITRDRCTAVKSFN